MKTTKLTVRWVTAINPVLLLLDQNSLNMEGDALLPLLFIFALEYAISKVQFIYLKFILRHFFSNYIASDKGVMTE
jgi:hypothetical protein